MIIITPLDQQMYFKQLDSKYAGSIHGHLNQPLKGWRAKRQQAENRLFARKEQTGSTNDKQRSLIGKGWIARLSSIFIKPRFAD
jgi:hypothetical protein